jgi:hypothetical protein
MPTRITHFLHDSLQTGSQSLGTAFDTADVHVHDMTEYLPAFQKNGANFRGIVGGIHVRLTSGGAPSATKVTIRICADADGDYTLVPDTEATLVAGVTTTTSQCAAFSVNLPLFQILASPGNGNLYLFAKVDDATTAPVFAQSCITWQE